MFAGPNGSGKSTLKSVFSPSLLGVYLNPDEIEGQLRKEGGLSFGAYGIQTTQQELRDHLRASALLRSFKMEAVADSVELVDGRMTVAASAINSYLALSIAEFLRLALMRDGSDKAFVAEVTGGKDLEIHADTVPAWFKQAVLKKIQAL
jgi:ABC-type branched-subunit amino acid transport system ATPase component